MEKRENAEKSFSCLLTCGIFYSYRYFVPTEEKVCSMKKKGNIFMVASGKGGVGKSSLTVCIGRELARLGCKVLLVEMEPGLGIFDLMLGVPRGVCDLSDYLTDQADAREVMLPVAGEENLQVMLAPTDGDFVYDETAFAHKMAPLADRFDMILMETPPGFGSAFSAAMAVASDAVLVATPDRPCLRDGRAVSDRLDLLPHIRQRLVINRLDVKSFLRRRPLMDLDEAIDTVGARLLGVVPMDEDLPYRLSDGAALQPSSRARQACRRIAQRLAGQNVPLDI